MVFVSIFVISRWPIRTRSRAFTPAPCFHSSLLLSFASLKSPPQQPRLPPGCKIIFSTSHVCPKFHVKTQTLLSSLCPDIAPAICSIQNFRNSQLISELPAAIDRRTNIIRGHICLLTKARTIPVHMTRTQCRKIECGWISGCITRGY